MQPGTGDNEGIAPLDAQEWAPTTAPLARVLAPLAATARWVRSDAVRTTTRRATADALEGVSRVVRSTRWPTRQGLLDFLSHQLLINSVAWTAGMIAAGLVTRFFEVRGFRNLWGLAGSGSRTLVNPDDYQLIMTVASFSSGLLMMIFIRHFLFRWVEEMRALRSERRG